MIETILALSPFRRAIAAGVSAVVLMGLGGVAWEYAPFVGAKARIERVEMQLFDVSGQLTYWTEEAERRKVAREICEADRLSLRNGGAQTITDTAQRNSQAARDAFNAGYAAGKTAGRAACPLERTADAPSDPAPRPVADLVRDEDLAAAFNASVYRPGAALRP